MTKDLEVTFYVGYGTVAQVLWSGPVPFLPRIGERVRLRAFDYTVDRVVHIPPRSKREKYRVEVTIR